MCAICGIVAPGEAPPIDEARLVAMRDTMISRGPDDAGIHLGPSVALGSRRLAILDLSERGRMPMSSPDGRFHIVHNGEIYNYRELRAELEQDGYVFRSNTDTEVLLALYATLGEEMLPRLNGMFAFAIWDAVRRRLFCARDRLGVKPFHYVFRERDGVLAFASEPKALRRIGFGGGFEPDTWEELLCFRYVAGARTPFSGILRLLPGHVLTWQNGRLDVRRWWSLADAIRRQRSASASNAVAWFRTTFDEAVAYRRISDVPVGVLLSGGLDSASVAASLHRADPGRISSFTIRFPEPRYDEGDLARAVATHLGLDHHELFLDPTTLPSLVEEASRHADEPLAHASDVHLYAIARYAKPHVTVLLSGEGADELLGGYVRYRPLLYPVAQRVGASFASAVSALPRSWPFPARAVKWARLCALGSLERFVLYDACEVLPSDLAEIGFAPTENFPYRREVLAESQAVYPGEPVRQAMYLDQHTFLASLLHRNDRMTMGASIECREPFLDYRLVERVAALPIQALFTPLRGKRLLHEALGDRLPPILLRGRKWGFGVPWSRYLREIPALRDQVRAIPDAPIIRNGPFSRARLARTVAAFLSGDDRHEALVRQLYFVTAWERAVLS